jgi:Amiloride-sensitive sodium channel
LDTLRAIRIPFSDIIADCKFNNEKIDCLQSFKELLLPKAMCYKFNGVKSYRHETMTEGSEHWSIDDGYKPGSDLDSHPRQASRAGQKFGFSFLLRLNKKDMNIICSRNAGFSV